MYPILILRSEVVCLILLVFLLFTARFYRLNKESKSFIRILRFAIAHLVFDIVTVLTVNNTGAVPGWVNWTAHVLFYLTAIFYSNEIMSYVVALCYPSKAKKLYALGHILTLVYILCLPFLKIEYEEDIGTWSSTGPAAYVGYGLAFFFFIAALVMLFTHMKGLPPSVKRALIPMMLALMITEICQIVWRSVLFTGGAVTIVTVGFFFSLENPVEVFKKKAMTDALTGVLSRRSYEDSIEKLDEDFKKKPSKDYIFVFCDINDLRGVNNRFGHAEGDNYITLVTTAINRCMKSSTAVYRIGGDEFLIYYYQTAEETVEAEIRALHAACEEATKSAEYTVGVSLGYAKSDETYATLGDVVKTADYFMYQNKTQKTKENADLGAKLNYAGLTDKMFDVICASTDRNYLFLTNLDTGVTRIAAGWKEYFGLDSEFFSDFIGVWKEHIHPDDYAGYMDDIVAVLGGHKKYHSYEYLAKKPDGEYVKVSCRGAVYRDGKSGASYFTGFITNHGMEENVDPLTGLRNFDELTSCVCERMDAGKPFAVLKLKLNNFAHVNMLYGYNEGNEIIRKIAVILKKEMAQRGEVFCQSSVNFTLLFDGCDEESIKSYYATISAICAAGLEIEKATVPVLISGGAYINHGSRMEIKQMRGNLVYALEESESYQRNKLVFYREAGAAFDGADVSLLATIHADALAEQKYFKLRYQPIVDMESGKTASAEALLRWDHPTYGEVPPGKFIAFIENDPCYYRLGLAILEHAVADAKTVREKIPEFRINVNITALQLQNEKFIDHVCEILQRADYPAEGLVLELTERCKEMNGKFLAKKIAELRSRGVLVAFDDLGTGYSTINLLMDIPVDEIKLDRDFVKDLATRENYQHFVRALVVGRSSPKNNYTICFEGIETDEMLQFVKGFGPFLAQGYYFAKPLLKDEFFAYVDGEEFAPRS